tara:strand:+ start:9062 stop:9253 length:192 start_codon:yes stop_codon:yes gene_type:complete
MGKLKTKHGGIDMSYIPEPLPEDLKWAVGHAAAHASSREDIKEIALDLLNIINELRNDFSNIH